MLRLERTIQHQFYSDRTFGNIPKDTIRVWYRPSENKTYVLRPDDLTNKKINVNYTGRDGNIYTAVFTLQLKQSITNATSSETLDSIRENAPKNYASQDRMITAQDYNTILSNNTGGVQKVKSINRTFSGHSRYPNLLIQENIVTYTYKAMTQDYMKMKDYHIN